MRLERSSFHDQIVFKGGPSKVQVFIINGIDCSSSLEMQIFFSSSCRLEIEMNNKKCIDAKYESKIFQPVKFENSIMQTKEIFSILKMFIKALLLFYNESKN